MHMLCENVTIFLREITLFRYYVIGASPTLVETVYVCNDRPMYGPSYRIRATILLMRNQDLFQFNDFLHV